MGFGYGGEKVCYQIDDLKADLMDARAEIKSLQQELAGAENYGDNQRQRAKAAENLVQLLQKQVLELTEENERLRERLFNQKLAGEDDGA